MSLDDADVALVKGMLKRGDRQSDIATWFGCNSGRVAEINTGKRSPEIRAAPLGQLPPPGPYQISARSALKTAATLEALRDLIDQTLAEVRAWERGHE
ncbi:MAG: hypothetical protein ACJ8FU_08410 [Xanthobacteraceae bacterium]